MVAAEAAREAIELARQNPTLAVGLHLVAVDGPAVLPHSRIPLLVNEAGFFPDTPVRLGLRYAFNGRARSELADELAAQFERFAATGLPLSHVDGHKHMHMHPAVFDRVLPLARRFGAKGIRIVRDDLRFELRFERRNAVAKVALAGIFSVLARRCRGCGLLSPRRTYGLFHSGRMTARYTLSAIHNLADFSELYFHPTAGPRLHPLGPNPEELEVLLSPQVRDAIDQRPLLLSRYEDLEPVQT
jgi:hopanoid biosynthesis associated protein HpnK